MYKFSDFRELYPDSSQEGEVISAAVRFQATLAKMGFEPPALFGALDKSKDIEGRNKMRRAINAAGERLQAIVNSKGKWSDKHQSEYDELMEFIGGAQIAIDRFDQRISGAEGAESIINAASGLGSSTTPLNWKTRNGELRVLGKNDRMASARDLAGGGFGFGEYVAAMVAGTSRPEIRAALTEGTDSAGGYTVPKHLMSELIDAMRAKTVTVQAGALTVPLETEKTTIARLDSDPQAGWRLEAGSVAQSDPTFGAVTFTARSLACLVKVSRELLEDSINIDSALMQAFAGAMGGELDRVALFGSGETPEPRGLFNTTGVSVVSMGDNGAAIAGYGKMLDAIYELENADANPATAWVMAPRTSRVLNGLTDTTGQPLNAPRAVSDIPRLVSTVVPVNQKQGTAENASSIILGDFSQLLIGVRTQLRIEVLREAFASTMEYAFLAHLRADIAVAQPKAFAIVKGVIPA